MRGSPSVLGSFLAEILSRAGDYNSGISYHSSHSTLRMLLHAIIDTINVHRLASVYVPCICMYNSYA